MDIQSKAVRALHASLSECVAFLEASVIGLHAPHWQRSMLDRARSAIASAQPLIPTQKSET